MTVRAATDSRGDRGSIALEFVFFAGVVFALLGLIVAYGRVGQVNGSLESGTRDAARMATVSRSYDEALAAARRAVADSVTVPGCRDSLQVTVSRPFEPGAAITVSASCQYSLADAGMFFSGVTVHPTSSFTSSMDPNRGIS
ncbi:TadE/TadG family type IV pilus assembly protein [Luteipulveratus mongoliensis]|uniref:TadE/TadG family type IV pilus assembly protein n=1 Tax=Luteipulveratus mongoliensis TaxID=571913 RepID=UPI0006990480|nr:TadE family protein [Luteipulveratus mongoliensis]